MGDLVVEWQVIGRLLIELERELFLLIDMKTELYTTTFSRNMDPRDYLCNKSPLATESQRIVLLLPHVNWLASKIFVSLLKVNIRNMLFRTSQQSILKLPSPFTNLFYVVKVD